MTGNEKSTVFISTVQGMKCLFFLDVRTQIKIHDVIESEDGREQSLNVHMSVVEKDYSMTDVAVALEEARLVRAFTHKFGPTGEGPSSVSGSDEACIDLIDLVSSFVFYELYRLATS